MKKPIFLLLAAILVSGLVFNGCGEKKTTTTAPAQTTAPATTTGPKYGGTIKVTTSSTTDAAGWPAEYQGGAQMSAEQLAMEPLLRGDNKGNVYPWLATSYTLADDLTSVTFTLRKDVQFHDGTPFDAQAVKWNLDNIIAAKSQPAWKSVEVLADDTIRVNFSSWQNTIFSAFADSNNCWMISPTAFQTHGKDWCRDNPTGTGPFKFASRRMSNTLPSRTRTTGRRMTRAGSYPIWTAWNSCS